VDARALAEACALQPPLSDNALIVVARGEKEDKVEIIPPVRDADSGLRSRRRRAKTWAASREDIDVAKIRHNLRAGIPWGVCAARSEYRSRGMVRWPLMKNVDG
jgi:hypothetical protein